MRGGHRTWRLETRTVSVPGGIVLYAKGRIGSVTAPAFAAAIAAARRMSSSVVIDFEEVDYISGEGIAALCEASAQSGDGCTVLYGLSDPVRITLELSGSLDALTIADDHDDGLRRIQRGRFDDYR